MKMTPLVVLVAALPLSLFAQFIPLLVLTNSAPPTADASSQKQPPNIVDSSYLKLKVQPKPQPATRIAGMDFTADGALVRAARAGQVWQAINPFAPAEFGDGYDNVTLDPHTRQPKGIVLVSFHFGAARRSYVK